jgi:hypothetical protein
LKGIIRIVLDEINTENGTDYQYTDVIVNFEPQIPTNDAEIVANAKVEAETEQIKITNLLNVATMIGDEKTLKGICSILDLDFDELKDQLDTLNEEQNTTDAVNMLNGVVTDEQPTETSIGTIPE